MRRTIQRSLVIVLVGATLGLVANAISPRRIPLITPAKARVSGQEFIPLAPAHDFWSTGAAFFLDARSPADYVAGHIANSFNLPAEEFNSHWTQVASFLTTGSVIVCYCDGVECDLSHRLAEQLRLRGYTNVRILQNAWTEWNKAGYPTTKGAQP
jgi:rhodanese-related sulfurtransferase